MKTFSRTASATALSALSGLLLLSSLPLLTACGGGKKAQSLPDELLTGPDSRRLEYLMERVPADSIARFIILSAAGRNGDLRIDSLTQATNFVYERLQASDLESFQVAFDDAVNSLPLPDKMRILFQAGTTDPQRLGYQLGLEYLSTIRDGGLTAEAVEKELDAFRTACGEDTATHRRFLIGLRTALQVDSGKGIPPEIYNKYSK